MSVKRLLHTGIFDSLSPQVAAEGSEVPSSLDKKAMLVYAGEFESMDGPVEVSPETLHSIAASHNTLIARLKQLAGLDEIPVRKCPPIQLDHSRSARDTVGRLVGNLEVSEHEKEDGTKVPALFGTLRILGRENVEKVLDGRWSELSIGADFEEGRVVELTITPFPAAAEAAMLAKKENELANKKPGLKRKRVSSSDYKSYSVAIWENTDGALVSFEPEIKGEEWVGDALQFESEALAMDWIRKQIDGETLTIPRASKLADGSGLPVNPTRPVDKDAQGGDSHQFSQRAVGLVVCDNCSQSVTDICSKCFGARCSDCHKKVFGLSIKQKYKGVHISAEQVGKGKWVPVVDGSQLPQKCDDEKEALAEAKEFVDIHQEDGQRFSKEKLSTGDDCHFQKASDGKWYLFLNDRPYGPFSSEADAEKYLDKNFANPGGWSVDRSGTNPPPQGAKRFSKGDEMDKAKLKKHLMETTKCSEEEADKKLAEMPEEEQAKLSAEVEESEKKLAAEEKEKEEKLAAEKADEEKKEKEESEKKLAARKEKIAKLSADFRKSGDEVRLSARKAAIHSRLMGLRAQAKISPAEIKKIDLSAMAKKTDEAVDAVMKSYEDREPVIPTGALGSTKALSLSALGSRDAKGARLAQEHVSHMPFTKRALENQAKLSKPAKKRMGEGEAVEVHIDTTPHDHFDFEGEYNQVCGLVDSNPGQAKEHLKGLFDRVRKHLAGSEQGYQNDQVEMSALVEKVKMMQDHFDEVLKIADAE